MTIDMTKGFDVIVRGSVFAHFDTYAEAWECYKQNGGYVRYWLA